MNFLRLCCSGAQTGVDQAALIAAKLVGIPTTGWIPKGFRTLTGPRPEFAVEYNIKEHKSEKYPPRTRANVYQADGTLRIAQSFSTPGEKCTLKAILDCNKPYLNIKFADIKNTNNTSEIVKVIDWIKENEIRFLNVAGNSEENCPGIQECATQFLIDVFRELET